MDNLSVHRSKWVRELIEQRGCQLRLLPGYSPDLNPIEGAFSKVKNLISKAKARTLDALFEATSEALAEVSADDARGLFEHCGYRTPQARRHRPTQYENRFSGKLAYGIMFTV